MVKVSDDIYWGRQIRITHKNKKSDTFLSCNTKNEKHIRKLSKFRFYEQIVTLFISSFVPDDKQRENRLDICLFCGKMTRSNFDLICLDIILFDPKIDFSVHISCPLSQWYKIVLLHLFVFHTRNPFFAIFIYCPNVLYFKVNYYIFLKSNFEN